MQAHCYCHRKHIARRPIKALGQPEDVAGIVSFLASKDASIITGTQPKFGIIHVLWLMLTYSGQCVSSSYGFLTVTCDGALNNTY